jgi:hypothetical protein
VSFIVGCDMKTRRLLVLVVAAFAVIIILVFAASRYWQRRQTPFKNAPKLISALQTFSRDQLAGGRQLPPEVSLEDLVRGRYLTSNDVRRFAGMEVTFITRADDTYPQMILARARTQDGHFFCLLADGSVQQFTASTLKKALENARQPDGAADQSQPVRSATNRTSAAAGSGR